MGIGFLAMLSGILNIDQSLYEAAYMDGMKSKFQEIFYITIPAMKKSGFPAELAGNIESNASYLGNMIPPSSNIVGILFYTSFIIAGDNTSLRASVIVGCA